MLAVKEKHIKSIRYLFRIFVYAVNMFLLLCSGRLLEICVSLCDVDRLTGLMESLSGETVRMDGDVLVIVGGLILMFLLLCVSIFLSLNRFMKYEMLVREPDRKLLSSLGWRRRAIVRYEQAFFLADFLGAWALGAAAMELLWQFMRKQVFITVLEELTGRTMVNDIAGAIITGAVVLLLAAVFVDVKVERREL